MEEAKAIEWYKVLPHGVSVKCRPVEELARLLAAKGTTAEASGEIRRVSESLPKNSRTRRGATKDGRSGLSDEAAIQRYFEWKAAGKIPERDAQTIDAIVSCGSAATAGTALRSYFARHKPDGQRALFGDV